MKSILFSVTVVLSALLNVESFSPTTHGSALVRKTALFSTTEEKTDSPAAPKSIENNNQAKYGNELALPDTYVRCGRCATSYALTDEDLGEGKGRRVECSVCGHSWFQSRDRLFNVNEGRELIPLPQVELDRIAKNIEKGRDPDFTGDTKFFVGNLDFDVQEADLWELFGEIGDVGEVSLVTGPDGRSRGFAFVTMMDEGDSDKCLELDSTELKGRAINVKIPN